MELRNYETTFILTPVLSSEQQKEVIGKFRSYLQEKKAEIIHEDKIGLKRLAYPIQHKTTGVYHVFEFKATPNVISGLETEYRRDERVIRSLTFVLDKHAVDYNTQKRNSATAKKSEPKKEVAA